MPDATRETRMPFMLVWSRFVLRKAFMKLPPLIPSKAFAGKLVSHEQPYHALEKFSPLEVLIDGKLVSDEQPCHAL